MDESTQTKRCPRCKEYLPLAEFGNHSAKPDGLNIYCRACQAQYQREYRAKKPEKMRQLGRDQMRRRRATNPEAQREYMRGWRKANAEKVKASRNAWNEANRERVRTHGVEAKRRWKLANPNKLKQYDLARRALLAAVPIGQVDLTVLWAIQDGICGLCDAPIDRTLQWPDPMSPSVDHIVPLARGGAHEQDNLQYAHLFCNLSKGARLPNAG